MKKFFILLSILYLTPVWAETNLEPLLNQVTLQLKAEQWLTTKTALVTIAVNAAVTDQGIEKIQTDVMQKLKQFSTTADWHILSFDRQQDKSGLENLQIVAEGRLLQSELANLRSKAKTITRPGETFTISNVLFNPSESEIKQANTLLRNEIYQQAKTEIDALNKLYPEQNYYLHRIDFVNNMPPVFENNTMMMKAAMIERAPQAAPLSVGNKQSLQALVVLAAMPAIVSQKLANVKQP